MPLTKVTFEKLRRTDELVRQYGRAYAESAPYRARPVDFLPPMERSLALRSLALRSPKDTLWFDVECLRGGWGVLAQAAAGQQELRLIVSFRRLGWSGSRRRLTEADLSRFIEQQLEVVCPPGRYTEAEYERISAALKNARALGCVDMGDGWTSAYATLAHEQAWERATSKPERAMRLWESLGEGERATALARVRELWNVLDMPDEACRRELYALAMVSTTRWGIVVTDGLGELAAVVISAAQLVQNEAEMLTRPYDLIPPVELAVAFGASSRDLSQAIERSYAWFVHLGTGPATLAPFGRGSGLTTILGRATARLGSPLLAIAEDIIAHGQKVEALYRRVRQAIVVPKERLLAWVQIPRESRPAEPALPSELAAALADPVLDPRLTADIGNFLSLLEPAALAELTSALGELTFHLGELQYMWYNLWDAAREVSAIDKLLVDQCQRYPLWDAPPKHVVELFGNHAAKWAAGGVFDGRQGFEQYLASFVEQENRDAIILPPEARPGDDFYRQCAQVLAQSKEPIVGANSALIVGKLVARYENITVGKKRAGFERLQAVRDIGVTVKSLQTICLKLLDWYDGLLEAQREHDESREAWDDIVNLAKRRDTESLQERQQGSTTTVAAPVVLPAQIQTPANPASVSPVGIAPAPSVMKGSGPVLMFDTADEQEVDRYREQLAKGNWQTAGSLERQLRALAEEVITTHKFSFKDDVSRRRFVQLFVSRLKDVRSLIDVREVLLKPVTSGGLGLPNDKVEQVINIIEQAKQEFEQSEGGKRLGATGQEVNLPSVVPVPVQALPPPLPTTPSGVVLPKGDKLGLEIQMPEDIVWPAAPAASAEPAGAAPSSAQLNDWRAEMLEELARISPESPLPAAGVANQARPQLSDIKAPPRTLGPLEELKTLSLTDFRRLNPSPLEALAHVRAKLDLIGEASVARRLEAVRAWQASPLYQLYLQLGRESIELGKTVAELTAEHQAAGQVTLSDAEFDAIVDFNSKIRF